MSSSSPRRPTRKKKEGADDFFPPPSFSPPRKLPSSPTISPRSTPAALPPVLSPKRPNPPPSPPKDQGLDAKRRSVKTCQFVIAREQQLSNNYNPFHHLLRSVRNGDLPMVKFLTENFQVDPSQELLSPPPDASDLNSGDTAASIAKEEGHEEILAYLSENLGFGIEDDCGSSFLTSSSPSSPSPSSSSLTASLSDSFRSPSPPPPYSTAHFHSLPLDRDPARKQKGEAGQRFFVDDGPTTIDAQFLKTSDEGAAGLSLPQYLPHFTKKFSLSPQKAVAELLRKNYIPHDPQELAKLLHSQSDQLDKVALGEYLGERDAFVIECLKHYIQMIDFEGATFVKALRKMLAQFRLPGESQKIERITECFAEVYFHFAEGGGVFAHPDTVFILSYSTIMLNTDAHNPQVKKKMTLEQFVGNNRGIDQGNDLPASYLQSIYDDIQAMPIRLNEDDPFPEAIKRGFLDIYYAKDRSKEQKKGKIKRKKLWCVLDSAKGFFFFQSPKKESGVPLASFSVGESVIIQMNQSSTSSKTKFRISEGTTQTTSPPTPKPNGWVIHGLSSSHADFVSWRDAIKACTLVHFVESDAPVKPVGRAASPETSLAFRKVKVAVDVVSGGLGGSWSGGEQRPSVFMLLGDDVSRREFGAACQKIRGYLKRFKSDESQIGVIADSNGLETVQLRDYGKGPDPQKFLVGYQCVDLILLAFMVDKKKDPTSTEKELKLLLSRGERSPPPQLIPIVCEMTGGKTNMTASATQKYHSNYLEKLKKIWPADCVGELAFVNLDTGSGFKTLEGLCLGALEKGSCQIM